MQCNAYILGWMAYNVGVTLSRTSVSFFEIRRVWVLTLLQFLNLLLWLAEAHTHLLRDKLGDGGFILMLVWLVYVGLMGGATYCNCMHIMNTSPTIPDHLRELGVNVTFSLLNIGIMFSSALFILLNITVYDLTVIYPNSTAPGTNLTNLTHSFCDYK